MITLINTLAAPRVVRLIALVILLAIVYVSIMRPWRSALLLDAALVLLTIYRPWPILLALAVVQIAYRWSPPLATFMGDLFDARFTGLTMALAHWWLPGWSSDCTAKPSDGIQTGQTIALPAPQRAMRALPDPPAPLPLTAMLERVNRTPTYPHTVIVGGTRLGKTTMALAIASDRDSDFVICTPKGEREDSWASFPAARTIGTADDPDWGPIAHATSTVYREMNARRYEHKNADRPLTLIIDEVTEALDEIPALKQQLIRMWKTGASANIRVLVIDPEENVRAWGLENRGDIRRSMLYLRVADDRSWSIGRYGSPPESVDARGLTALASAAMLNGRVWPVEAATPLSAAPSVVDSRQMQTADDGKGRSAPDDLIEFLYTIKGLRDRERMRTQLKAEYGFGLDNNRFSAVKKRVESGVDQGGAR